MEFLPIEINGEKVFAGFWKRLGAAIIDIIVFLPVMFISYYIQSISMLNAILITTILAPLYYGYIIFFHYKFGATIGKMVVGIQITLPNGHKIGFKEAFLRSSVEIVITCFVVTAQLIALKQADPDIYLNAGWADRAKYIVLLLPTWYGLINLLNQAWFWSEFIVLLFNKRKRAIHDFIAGTVVIKQKYAKDQTSNPFNKKVIAS